MLYNCKYSQYELFFYSDPQAEQLSPEEVSEAAAISGTGFLLMPRALPFRRFSRSRTPFWNTDTVPEQGWRIYQPENPRKHIVSHVSDKILIMQNFRRSISGFYPSAVSPFSAPKSFGLCFHYPMKILY